jgi:hypothetical protein
MPEGYNKPENPTPKMCFRESYVDREVEEILKGLDQEKTASELMIENYRQQNTQLRKEFETEYSTTAKCEYTPIQDLTISMREELNEMKRLSEKFDENLRRFDPENLFSY